MLLSLLLAVADWASCVHVVNGTTYDLSPLRDVVFTGGDPAYRARQYNVSVCSTLGAGLPSPCIDELTKTPLNGSIYQLTLAPDGHHIAFCWDVLAGTAAPLVLPAGSTNATVAGEALVLRFSHVGDAHIDCTPNMTVDVHLRCPASAHDAELVGGSDRACHYHMTLGTPHACAPAAKAELLHAATAGPVVALTFCNITGASADQLLWEYNDEAMLIHHVSGLALYATGEQSDTQPTPVAVAAQVQMNAAQWLADTAAAAVQLHAFRGGGSPGRCLQVGETGGGVEVGTCDSKASVAPAQRFLVPVHGSGQPAQIQTAAGLCLALVRGNELI